MRSESSGADSPHVPGRLAARDTRVGAAVLLLVLAAAACGAPQQAVVPAPPPGPAPPPPAVPLAALAQPADLLGDGDAASLREAVGRSLAWLETVPPDTSFDYGVRRVTARDLAAALGAVDAFLASAPDAAALQAWVRARFDVVESVGEPPGEVLVTGYFEPVIPGSPVPSERARVPVHARPPDLVRRSPSWRRRARRWTRTGA
jgi:membrane-bound lytic murein transglycosylase A